MNTRLLPVFFIMSVICLVSVLGCGKPQETRNAVILSPENASFLERLAAKEIRRYVYLRTGDLLNIVHAVETIPEKHGIIIVAGKDHPLLQSLGDTDLISSLNTLVPEGYILKSVTAGNRDMLVISGGDEIGILYGAYHFAELLGIRFFLHGDVIPDKQTAFSLPAHVDEVCTPLFDIRGIQPFHDFPEGPDWWNLDDYLAIISRLPKLRMNFFGLHTYPEGGPNAEPTVWIGLPGNSGENGKVTFSYPSSYQNTMRGNWGYDDKPTGDYVFGGSLLFERDDYGNDVMSDMCPSPETPEDRNEVFRRAGSILGEVFRFAHTLGIKTCVGTETPLTIPELVAERLKKMGKNPVDSVTVQELYEGIFRRIAKTYPIDYYWFWTPENWTWSGNTEEQVNATITDLGAAMATEKNVSAPFELATCGWVLGPRNDRALFDNFLPESMPMSCINRGVGTIVVDRAFARVSGRPKWAIPWLEDDPGLTSAQLWVGRMRCDAADALRYGCSGLIGIHWRTRILGPNVAALARAAWNQKPWISKPRISGALDGHISPQSDRPVAGTEDDILYQTGRHNVYNYRFIVPDGTYTVILKFCELTFMKKGARVFDVYIQGEKALEKLDIFAQAGGHRALDFTFEDVEVNDGFMEISFEPWGEVWNPEFGQACISAIVIQGNGQSWKENCGGPAYNDYLADSALISSKNQANSDYLAETSQWEYAPARHLSSGDFYEDWALHQFGPEASNEIAQVFEKMDGILPRSSDWINGPGGWRPDAKPWKTRARDYAFLDELERLHPRIVGHGNRERFDYWLNNFRFMKSSAHVCCVWSEFNEAMEEVKEAKDEKARATKARENALPLYRQMVQLMGDTYSYLLATVSTNGEMGTVANVEQHILPGLLTRTGEELAEALGEELPEDVLPAGEYTGEPRVIVPAVRSSCTTGESLILKVIILDNKPPSRAELFWCEMGTGEYQAKPLKHIDRGVYTVAFPEAEEDIEYYIRIVTGDNKELYYPATAPVINQTVVTTGTD